jgi:hypothetical protein
MRAAQDGGDLILDYKRQRVFSVLSKFRLKTLPARDVTKKIGRNPI